MKENARIAAECQVKYTMKGYFTGLRRMKLKTRVVVFFLLIVIVLAITISTVSIGVFSRVERESALQSYEALLVNCGARIGSYMTDLDNMSYALMFNRATQSVLSASSRQAVSQSTVYANRRNLYYTLLLQATINTNVEISIHPLVATEPSFYSQSATLISADYDFTQSRWYAAFQADTSKEKLYLLNDTHAFRTGSLKDEPAHIVAYRINYVGAFQSIGYLCLYIDPQALVSMLSDLSDRIEGLVLIDTNTHEIVAACGDEALCSSLTAMDDQRGQLTTLGQKQYIIMSEQLNGPNWSIVCAYDYSKIQEAGNAQRLIVLGFSLLLVALCIPVIVYFSRKTLHPIEEMLIGMEWVKLGKLDFQLPEYRQDELGKLVSSMNDSIRQLEEANRSVRTLSALQHESDMKALRQQINPHFLYNTLNMIIGMASMKDDAAIIEVSKTLSDMFRSNLSGAHMISLRNELEQAKRYIRISQYRFRDLFTVSYRIEDDMLLEQFVPRMTLQPLIENSIIHGFSESGTHGSITISIERRGDEQMQIVVEDTGSGMLRSDLNMLRDSLIDTAILPSRKAHVGLHNVYARLKIEYGARMSFFVESSEGSGTQVLILLPIRAEGKEGQEHV